MILLLNQPSTNTLMPKKNNIGNTDVVSVCMQAAAPGSSVQTLAVSRETGDATITTIVWTTRTNRTAVRFNSFHFH